MKNLKKSLQSVNKDLNALSKKVDKIIVAASKLEKPKSKKGVGVAELMKKTEFDLKKTYNIIYKLKSQGKIKSVGKGVYKKA
ncbi:MAG: hypothetical protein JRC55_06970 [Deltaproteobacteria bacterium]|nr:hypothetical protein [Deltaproteobacteria bacterium]